MSLTTKQLNSIHLIRTYDPVSRYLQNKDSFNFNTGDYLIKKFSYRNEWRTETVSAASSVPKRYKCIYVDELGIRFIVALTAGGVESSTIQPMTEFNDYQRWEVDPSYAEHIILNGDEVYDPSIEKKLEKNRRDKITRLNKKLAFYVRNQDDLKELRKVLKVGTKFRYSHDLPSAATSSPITITELLRADGRAAYKVNGAQWPNYFENLMWSVVFLVEPHSYEAI